MREFDETIDLKLEQLIAARPETVWRCWSDPELFSQWFAPPTVTVRDVDYQFFAGGKANLTMVLPDSTVMPLEGCVLEALPAKRLVTTDALKAGYRPAEKPFMTAIYDLEPSKSGTRYSAMVLHPTNVERQQHIDMGFYDGWGTTLKQLAGLAEHLERTKT